MHSSGQIIVLLSLLVGMAASIRWKKLTVPAAFTGGVVGWLVYTGGGCTGILMLAAFFVLGTAATSWHAKAGPSKDTPGSLDQKGAAAQPTRTTGQVLANGGVPALARLALTMLARFLVGAVGERAGIRSAERIKLWLRSTLFARLMAAPPSWADSRSSGALSTALVEQADAVEGFFARFYPAMIQAALLPIAFAAVALPVDWLVALLFLVTAPLIPVLPHGSHLKEGTLIGVAGYSLIALLYAAGHSWNGGFWIIVLSGAIGNLTDSILGASLERKGWLGNDMVNFLNTLAAGLLGGLLAWHSSWI